MVSPNSNGDLSHDPPLLRRGVSADFRAGRSALQIGKSLRLERPVVRSLRIGP